MQQFCRTNVAKYVGYSLRRHVFVWHIQGSQRKSFASGAFLSEKTSDRQEYPLRCLVFWLKMGICKGYPLWCLIFWFKIGICKGYPLWFAFLNSGRGIIQRISFASPCFGTQARWIRQGILYVFWYVLGKQSSKLSMIFLFSDQFADIFALTKRLFCMIWMLVSEVFHRFVVVSQYPPNVCSVVFMICLLFFNSVSLVFRCFRTFVQVHGLISFGFSTVFFECFDDFL